MPTTRNAPRFVRSAITIAIATTALATSACAPNHFNSVVRRAEAARDDYCGGEVAVKAVGSGYRAESCDETHYYRCYFQRRTGGRTQCCYEVEDEGSASSLISPISGKQTCANYND
jgi:hypothetical protein